MGPPSFHRRFIAGGDNTAMRTARRGERRAPLRRSSTVIGAPVPGMSPEQEDAAWRAAAPEARRIIASLLEEEFEDRLVRNGVLGERTGIYWAHDTPSGWNLADSNLFTRPFLMDQLERVLEENQAVTDGVLDALGRLGGHQK